LCEWCEGDDALAVAEDLAACTGAYQVLEPAAGLRYCMSLDIGTRRDATVLAVAHAETSAGGRRIVVDRVQRWTGTRLRPVSLSAVEEALLATWKRYHRPGLIFDFHQAAQLTERLRSAGVRCEEFVFSSSGVNRLARTLFGALRDRAILLPNDEGLLAELSAVRLIETGPGLLRLDHRAGEHDDRAIALAMLAAKLLKQRNRELRVEVASDLGYRLPPTQLDRHKLRVSPKPVPIVRPRRRSVGAEFEWARGQPGYRKPALD
jgi:phage FluMu gp28-like protein